MVCRSQSFIRRSLILAPTPPPKRLPLGRMMAHRPPGLILSRIARTNSHAVSCVWYPWGKSFATESFSSPPNGGFVSTTFTC
jgi:hypothetical protein